VSCVALKEKSLPDKTKLEVTRLGKVDYISAWEKQKRLHQALISGNGKDSLVICEHEPVIN